MVDNALEQEENNNILRDILFMELIQDEYSIGGKIVILGTPTSTSKTTTKWIYNGIHLPLQSLRKIKMKQYKIIIQIRDKCQK